MAVLAIAALLAQFAMAQENPVPPAPAAPVENAVPAPLPKGEERVPGQPNVIQDKHAFGVLPNYRTADGSQPYSPITVKQKFTIAGKDTLDGPSYVLAAFFSSIGQLNNSNASFGQGVKGYAHRYGTGLLDQDIGNMMTEAIMPSLLHEDPRYFRKGHGSVMGRVGYAASRVLVAKTDSGKWNINGAELLGNGITAAIGNAYYPDSVSFGDTMQRMWTQVGTDAVSQVLKEFWPDVKRKWFHKNAGNVPVPGSVQ
jgi:hypothetical protein